MLKAKLLKVICSFCMLVSFFGQASPPTDSVYVPEELQPWKKWVLDKHPKFSCPEKFDDTAVKQCVWPSELFLQIEEKCASFVMQVHLFADDFVVIPGDSVFWPCEVTANGKPVAVLRMNNLAVVELPEGACKLTGILKWENRPNSIRIPDGTALVTIQSGNKKTTGVTVDHNGMLWLKGLNESVSEDSLTSDNVEVKVFRLVTDAIPLYMTTVLKLTVSGNDREIILGKFLPEGSVPVYLHSTIPASIESNGNVRVQVKPGTWIVEMKCRFKGSAASMRMERKCREWPLQEVWALKSDPRLRAISIRGVAAIDPGQTEIPDEWKLLPVFLVSEKQKFEILEEHRGDFSPDPNVLKLDREMWLDFKGVGFTIKDHITGNVSRSGRLSMENGYTLGSVNLNGVPQLVTTVGNNSPGIEHRQGNLDLECLSRIDKRILNAAGWNQAFSTMTAELHLPPRYSLFHLSGADYVNDSWVSKWTVWDIFILLIIAVSIYRLYNIKLGLIAAAVLILTFHEKGAPLFLWLNLVTAIALAKVLPKGNVKKIINYYSTISFLLIAFLGVTFAIVQIRQALYPQLEMSEKSVESNDFRQDQRSVMKSEEIVEKSLSRGYVKRSSSIQNFDQYDASAKIQTGPSQPIWRWNVVSYGWSGPVESDQKVELYIVSPVVNSLLNFFRVLGVFLLLFGLGKSLLSIDEFKSVASRLTKLNRTALLIIASFLLIPSHLKAEIPSPELLNELETRLTEQGICGAGCISVQQANMKIDNEIVSIELVIDAAKSAVVQLPGNRIGWFAENVTINGNDASALSGTPEGGLLAVIPRGHNRVALSGRTSGNRGEIQFPLHINNMTASSDQWLISGIVNGKIPGGVVKIEKTEKNTVVIAVQKGNTHSDRSLPFVEVTRKVSLDKVWGVTTTVRRVSPESDPFSLQIPLLQNESVISSVVSDPIGLITVYMTKDQQEFTWNSTLKMTAEIVLEVPVQEKWVEVWSLDPSPRWHVETKGIVQIKQDKEPSGVFQVWHPLPGEKVVLTIQQPEPVSGTTMTIQSVSLDFRPGKKTSENILKLSVRSSQADRLQLKIPPNSVLEGVIIDGVSQIVTLNGGVISVPVHPGIQQLDINWKSKEDLKTLIKTPLVDCGINSANVNLQCTVPPDRWILFAGGPMVGPALLFWAILIVLLLISIGLGKIKNLPLRWYHWFLLSAGMSTVDNVGGVFVVAWFFVIASRAKITSENRFFNSWQIGCIVLTLAAIGSLVATIPLGLLSTPDMQVSGNFSSSYILKWYEDISGAVLPQGFIVSVPIWVYRTLMLIWSLWLALSLTKWTKWGWNSFSAGGIWKKVVKPKNPEVKNG